jgi:predicted phage terminase large subunit-like protein
LNPDLERLVNDPELLARATKEEIDYIERTLTAELALRSPADYETFDDPEYVTSPIHQLISDTIVKLIEGTLLKPDGTPYKKLMIRTPPQIGKSTLATIATAKWLLTKYPNKHVMSLSYNSDFAGKFGRAIRDGIEKNADTFNIGIAKDNRSNTQFAIAGHKGDLLAVGLGAGVTGNPADVILVDDPIKNAEEALSQMQRGAGWDQYSSAVKSRLRPHTLQIFTYTHWHGDDIGARLLINEPGDWYQITIPAISLAEDDILGRPIGTGIEIPEPPFNLTTEWWEHLRSQTVPWIWSALYQQQPVIEGAGIFHKEHIRYASFQQGGRYIRLHKPTETPNFQDYDLNKCWYFGTADLATAQKNYSDYTAIGTYLVTPDFNLVQVGQFHRRIDSSEHEETIDRIMQAHDLRFMSVENKVYGITLIQTMIRKGKRVRKSQADTDKVTRAITAATYMQAGRIYFLQGEAWLDDLIMELLIFDKGAHDDQVDCLAYAARIVAEHEKHPIQYTKESDPQTYDEKFWRAVDKKLSNKKSRKYNPDW